MDSALQYGFRLGSYTVLPRENQITGPDGTQHIQPKLLEVLVCLAEHKGELTERSTLIETVWGRSADSDDDLKNCISELRRVLHDHREPPSYIETISKRGYRLLQKPQALFDSIPDTDEAVPIPANEASREEGGIAGLFAELRRRRVFRVAAVYLVVAWLVIQIGETTFPALGIPEWALAMLIVLAVLGFPITLVIAWAFQVTPEGVVVELPEQQRRGRWRDFDFVVIGALLIAVAFLGYRLVSREAAVPVSEPTALRSVGEPLVLDVPVTENSIAVLPFVNMSDNPANEYLADGFSEDILNLLTRLKELKVAARTSTFFFKGKNIDIRTIANQLAVSTVLEGSVRREGDTIRVTAQLIDAATGFHMWSQSYDREVGDLFKIQDDIAGEVVGALRPVLSPESQAQLESRVQGDIAAYDYYLQGRAYMRQPKSEEVLNSAQKKFDQALEIDSDFAPAYAGLCDANLAQFELSRSTGYFEAAERACHRAVTLDIGASDVYAALGSLYVFSGQYDKAEKELRMAISLNANSVDAYSSLAKNYALQNRLAEAEAHYNLVIRLQPGYWAGYRNLGNFLFSNGRSNEAIAQYRRMIELTPDNATGYNNLGAAHYMLGQFEEAATAWQHSLDLRPTRDTYANTGTMYYYLARYDDAVEMYKAAIDLAPQDHQNWGALADTYRAMKQRAQSESTYERAIELAGEELRINSSDASTMALMAHYYAAVGQAARAGKLLQQALELEPKDLYVRYDAALVFTSLGETEKALDELERAVELGYLPVLLTVDAGLAPLQESDRFKSLLQ